MSKLELLENSTRHTFDAPDRERAAKKAREWIKRYRPNSLTLTEEDGAQVTIFCAWFIRWNGKECKFASLDNAATAFADACFHQVVESSNSPGHG